MRTTTLCLALLGMFGLSVQAATSDHFFHVGGSSFVGEAGNVVFNGEHFVAPAVATNSALALVFLDTNGVIVSNLSLSITGKSPRLAFGGGKYMLAWQDTNQGVVCGPVTNGGVGATASVASNASAESLSLRAVPSGFLAVWQSQSSNSAITAQTFAPDGSPSAPAFAVSSNATPQCFPSINMEGTNYLVCWMEQNTQSNDWSVLARRLDENGPIGITFTVSQTNSFQPHATACSLGENFLVAWGWDEGTHEFYHFPSGQMTNVWYQVVLGRMVPRMGPVSNDSFAIGRSMYWSTNPAVAFSGGEYLVAWSHWVGLQRVQRLHADGSPHGSPVPSLRHYSDTFSSPRIAPGAGRFCVLYPRILPWLAQQEETVAMMFGVQQTPDPSLVNLRRTTNGIISAQTSRTFQWEGSTHLRSEQIEVSTNLVDWEAAHHSLSDLRGLPVSRQLFIRIVDHSWVCIENLRALDWAKQQWGLDSRKELTDTPNSNDLAPQYLRSVPICPGNGTYTLGSLGTRPTCTISGHTL